ncbi:MAG: O-antigen ligase family protein [Bacteroides sp.]|nr:O-antigen ligase family protein [Bacteroides sp.]
MNILKSSILKRHSIIIFLIILYFPTFWGYVSLGTGQLIYLVATTILTLPFFYNYKVYKLSLPRISVLFLLWTITYIATLVIQPVINNEIILKDFSDIIRPFIYLYFFIIGCVFGMRFGKNSFFISALIVTALLSLVFDGIKFFEQFQTITKLYSVFEFGELNYIRYSGTFGFCYDFGFVALLIYSISIVFYAKKGLTFILGCLIMMLVGSRSVILAFGVINGLYFFLFSKKQFFKKIILIPVFVLVVVFLYVIATTWEIPVASDSIRYSERLVNALSGTDADGSLGTRNNQLEVAIERFNKSPIFGVGPSKNDYPIEIQLGYYISSWGIVGTVIFYFIQFNFGIVAVRGIKSRETIVKYFSTANLLWLISALIVGMSTPITDQVRVFQLYYLIQGYQYGIVKSVIKTSH